MSERLSSIGLSYSSIRTTTCPFVSYISYYFHVMLWLWISTLFFRVVRSSISINACSSVNMPVSFNDDISNLRTGEGLCSCSFTHSSAARPLKYSLRPLNITSNVESISDFPNLRGHERKYLRPFSINSASFVVLSTYSRLSCLNCTKSCTPIGNFCILFCSFLRLYCPPRFPRLHPREESIPATLALTCGRSDSL